MISLGAIHVSLWVMMERRMQKLMVILILRFLLLIGKFKKISFSKFFCNVILLERSRTNVSNNFKS